jgi:hypothetical protein
MKPTNLSVRFAKRLFIGFVLSSIILVGCDTQCDINSMDIISRSEWGALEPDVQGSIEGEYDAVQNPGGWFEYGTPLPQILNTIVVHHSALPLSDGPLEIQQKHMDFKGYADIGYHYLIDEDGNIYEGRSLNVRGAHTGGYNTGSIGIVLLCNFEETEPTEAQISSFLQLSQCLRDEYQITHIAGHRDFQPEETVCPGKNLETLLSGFAQDLSLEFGTQGYVGPSNQ